MIEARAVNYRYPGDADPVLREVTADVRIGEVIGIVGPNGSGKSTLGRLLKGLLLPSTGDVLVEGFSTRTSGLDARRRVGLLFQNPNSQIVNAVVEDEVAFGPENLGLPPTAIRERVVAALAMVGLEGRERMECHSLTMADKQRVALAAVLSMHPQYLILDEPTAWLEPAARRHLLREVFAWKSATDGAVVLVTHRMDEAQLCDRLYGMLDGRVEIVGTPDEVLQDESVRARLALDVPETFVLAKELRAAGLPVEPGEPIDRLAEAICRS